MESEFEMSETKNENEIKWLKLKEKEKTEMKWIKLKIEISNSGGLFIADWRKWTTNA